MLTAKLCSDGFLPLYQDLPIAGSFPLPLDNTGHSFTALFPNHPPTVYHPPCVTGGFGVPDVDVYLFLRKLNAVAQGLQQPGGRLHKLTTVLPEDSSIRKRRTTALASGTSGNISAAVLTKQEEQIPPKTRMFSMFSNGKPAWVMALTSR
jgi:hypothetical protein